MKGNRFTDRFELTALRQQHLQLSAVLTAVLVKTGPVTLSQAEAEASYPDAKLHYEETADGGVEVRVEAGLQRRTA